MWSTTTTTDDGAWVYYTEKNIRGRLLFFSSSSENKLRSIKIHDHMNNSISNSGPVTFCIQNSHRRSMSKGTLFS